MNLVFDGIETVNILGINIAAINMPMLIDATVGHLQDMKGKYICVSNVHTVITAYDDVTYRKIQNESILNIPDGGPLSTLGRWLGYKKMQRTFGPSYMINILKVSATKGYRHFLYGSTPETINKLRKSIEKHYPGVCIVGHYSPPFRELTKEENRNIIKMIKECEPDFIWVGLGAPKQERWMYDHKGEFDAVMVGVGAAFDYISGNIKRAPKWMQKCNMEWLYRLIQDPKRLFARYLYTNTKFILLVFKAFLFKEFKKK